MAEVPVEHYRLRSYQAEMVEESLRSNIVCVMDTGSGKTHM
jgi:ERCC4-related helicase